MTLLRVFVPALAIASGVYGQCSAKATSTISAAADASGLASCNTFSGSLALATAISGEVVFPQIREITGSFSANGATNMTSLSFPGLQQIGQDFTLESLTQLSTLSMPELSSVGGRVNWVTLNALQMLNFDTGLEKAGSINIQDTNLQNLQGLNLTQCDSVTIANNGYLQDISLDLTTLTGTVSVSYNAGTTTCSFPRLTSAGSINIRQCSSVDISSLKNVTGSASFIGNSFSNFSAPKLMMSNGFNIQNSGNLKTVSLPAYSASSGALNFLNNTALGGTISLPSLTHVGGSATFKGIFSNLALPQLNTISGTLTLASTKNINSVCSHYRSLSGNGQPIHGKVNCELVATNSNGGTVTVTGSSGGGSTSSAAAVANLVPLSPSKIGVTGVLAAMFGLFV